MSRLIDWLNTYKQLLFVLTVDQHIHMHTRAVAYNMNANAT